MRVVGVEGERFDVTFVHRPNCWATTRRQNQNGSETDMVCNLLCEVLVLLTPIKDSLFVWFEFYLRRGQMVQANDRFLGVCKFLNTVSVEMWLCAEAVMRAES